MTGVVPNITIVTPKIVALTIGQRLSSNLEENSVNSPVTHESIHTIIIKNKGGISHYYDYNALLSSEVVTSAAIHCKKPIIIP